MTKSTEKTLTTGFSGPHGGIVFIKRRRCTHFSVVPQPQTGNLTQNQCDEQTRLIYATYWVIQILSKRKESAGYVRIAAKTGKAPFLLVLDDCLKKLEEMQNNKKEIV